MREIVAAGVMGSVSGANEANLQAFVEGQVVAGKKAG